LINAGVNPGVDDIPGAVSNGGIAVERIGFGFE
jgi:hypothetical protein